MIGNQAEKIHLSQAQSLFNLLVFKYNIFNLNNRVILYNVYNVFWNNISGILFK